MTTKHYLDPFAPAEEKDRYRLAVLAAVGAFLDSAIARGQGLELAIKDETRDVVAGGLLAGVEYTGRGAIRLKTV